MKSKRIITLCKCCGKPILDRTAQARYHIDREPCYAAQQAHVLDQERKCREHQQSERKDLRADKRRRTGKPCKQETCHRCKSRRLPAGYHYACPEFYSRQHNNIEGDYIYAAWGYSGHPRPKGMEVDR